MTVDVRSLDDLAGFEGVKAGPKVGFLPKVDFFLVLLRVIFRAPFEGVEMGPKVDFFSLPEC